MEGWFIIEICVLTVDWSKTFAFKQVDILFLCSIKLIKVLESNRDFYSVLAPLIISRTPSPYITIGLDRNCSNDIGFMSLVKMRFSDPRWWP